MSKVKIQLSEEAGPKYSLIKEIKQSPLYEKKSHDITAYKYITENVKPTTMKANEAVPGQMILFEYMKPKTEEQLEYYDKYPCTLFFGMFQTKGGEWRILGFNIHYYPIKMRFQIMNKIFDMYKPIYTKYFNQPLIKEIDAFDYKYLMDGLEKAKLDFGVREYIPELCGKVWKVPANMWQVAVYTEGVFEKKTRNAIIKYWQDWVSGYYNKSSKPKKKQKAPAKKKKEPKKKEGFLKRLFSRFSHKK